MEYTEEENKTMSGLFSNKEKIDVNIVIYCKGANIKQKTIFWVFEVKKKHCQDTTDPRVEFCLPK